MQACSTVQFVTNIHFVQEPALLKTRQFTQKSYCKNVSHVGQSELIFSFPLLIFFKTVFVAMDLSVKKAKHLGFLVHSCMN